MPTVSRFRLMHAIITYLSEQQAKCYYYYNILYQVLCKSRHDRWPSRQPRNKLVCTAVETLYRRGSCVYPSLRQPMLCLCLRQRVLVRKERRLTLRRSRKSPCSTYQPLPAIRLGTRQTDDRGYDSCFCPLVSIYIALSCDVAWRDVG